ncbi:relaxase/mobilization nuclease domain-containing protein [Geotalea toluenoxydans]|uniref:relaxase/mobilization nuclease domain-containing protein n=1 Tax=Geotalea toluenoxydans TaxID=421624 RepID=UPI0006D11121|nr:relaxase/mobilization nuclease domain-containing protein [Geotalea toluenoxydans]
MIGKQVKGKGFRGVLNYVLNPDKGMLIGGNMDGLSARELTKEFVETRRLNPDLKRPVYHVSLSLSPGEQLNNFEWNQVAGSYLNRMGFKFSQYVVARHTDKEHDHIHIIANRIGLDGKTVSDSQDYKRSEAVIREIERAYGLPAVTSSRKAERRGLTSGELRLALKIQQPSIKMQLQEIVDQEQGTA